MLVFQLHVCLGLGSRNISDVLFESSVLLDGYLSEMLLLKSPKSVFLLLLLLFKFCFFYLLLSFQVDLVDLVRSQLFKIVGNVTVRAES